MTYFFHQQFAVANNRRLVIKLIFFIHNNKICFAC